MCVIPIHMFSLGEYIRKPSDICSLEVMGMHAKLIKLLRICKNLSLQYNTYFMCRWLYLATF